MAKKADSRHVVVAQFAGTHGVRGDFKIRSFTEDPSSAFTYGPLSTKNGKKLSPRVIRETKPAVFLCRDETITTPEACAEFKGALLTVPRTELPDTEEDDYYIDDLIGLEARASDGSVLGRVKAVPNYGAGDIVEVAGTDGLILVPFTEQDVPAVVVAEGYITIVPPEDDEQKAD